MLDVLEANLRGPTGESLAVKDQEEVPPAGR